MDWTVIRLLPSGRERLSGILDRRSNPAWPPELGDRNPDPLRLVADEMKAEIQSSGRPSSKLAAQVLVQSPEESARASERANRENQLAVVTP